MKYLMISLTCIFIIVNPNNLKAQGETAVPFLLIDVSPDLTGMAGTAVALPTTDVFGAVYNPAQMGYFGRNNNFAMGFYPTETEWLPGFNFSDLKWYNSSFALGYAFKSDVPIYAGIGYSYSKIDLGENVWTDATGNVLGTFNSYETSKVLSFGAAIDYYVEFNLGFSYKYISSKLVPAYVQVGSETKGGQATAHAFDFGFIINVPVLNFISLDEKIVFFDFIYPYLNISTGYALLNLGNEISYIKGNQSDPLPRLAKMGYGLSLGINSKIKGTEFNIFQIDFSQESRDLLIIRNQTGFKYKNMFGDINIIENVFFGKSNNDIDVTKGLRFNVLNTIQISSGKKLGEGYRSFNTSGFSINSDGILLMIALMSQNKVLENITNHFSIKYSWSEYDTENYIIDGMVFSGIQINLYGYW